MKFGAHLVRGDFLAVALRFSSLFATGYRCAHLLYIPITAVSCLIAAVVTHYAFSFDYSVGALVATFLLLAPLFVLLGPALRNLYAGSLLNLVIVHLLVVGHAIKIAAMKAPIHVADFKALPLLLKTLSGAYLIVGIALGVLLLAVLACCIVPRRRALAGLLMGSAYATVLVLSSGLWVDKASAWLGTQLPAPGTVHAFDLRKRTDEQVRNLVEQGGPLYLLYDWNSMKREIGFIPSHDEVAAIQPVKWNAPTTHPTRNVHVVLLESIWDSSVLDNVSVTGEPLDPRFVALWNQAGKPHALSPVLGGMTANAEFEVLCGLQAPSNSIVFLDNLQQATPCLPALFQHLGYHTVASHPHEASNWGRDRAYALVGFQEFNPITGFDLDDLDGDFLTDQSLFRQNLALLENQSPKTPVFNYIVTLSSHWAYVRNAQRRPDKVTITPDNLKLLPAYLNSSAYTTAAFMDWVEQVLIRDPDALIVAFGDHAPVLDSQPDVYTWLSDKVQGNFESTSVRQLVGMSRVPVLVIDGNEGAVRLPDELPLFELPSIIGEKAGLGPRALPQTRALADDILVRPLLGQLLAKVDGRWLSCGTRETPVQTAACKRAWTVQQKDRVVRQDLVAGDDYFLEMAGGAELTRGLADLKIVRSHKTCSFDVKQWGPSEATVGKPFNPTPNGDSTVWITFNSLRGIPKVLIGDLAAKVVKGDKLVTASAPTAQVTGKAGAIPVWLQCADEDRVQIGVLKIH